MAVSVPVRPVSVPSLGIPTAIFGVTCGALWGSGALPSGWVTLISANQGTPAIFSVMRFKRPPAVYMGS